MRHHRHLLAVVVALTLAAWVTACGTTPALTDPVGYATSSEVVTARAAAEQQINDRIDKLATVTSLTPIATVHADECHRRPKERLIDWEPRATYDFRCSMGTVVYFGAEGSMPDVLRSIQSADIATWASAGNEPTVAGTVAYALAYIEGNGRYPDGTRMGSPDLFTELEDPVGIKITWDGASRDITSNQVPDPSPCPPAGGDYRRCERTPDPAPDLAQAREEYDSVVLVSLGSAGGILPLGFDGSSGDYFEVPRS